MSSYRGKHAEYYDIFYRDKAYAAEAAFVDKVLARYRVKEGKDLLELACGTGRHAFQMEKLGYSVLATDYSKDLLKVARRKAKERKSKVKFRHMDMRELEVEGEGFDVAICLFDSIGYVQSDDAIVQVLAGVRRALRPGGFFIFEFWYAPAMLKHYEPTRVGRWDTPDGELLRISKTRLLEGEKLAEVHYEIFELRKDKTYDTISETQINRFFTVGEMEQFLGAADFQALAWLNGYTWGEVLDEHTWHVLAVARRPSS